MNRIFRDQVDKLARFYSGSRFWRGLPESEPESQASLTSWYLSMSTPRFRLTYKACIVLLHLMSLARRGSTFNRLDGPGKAELMDGMLASKNPLVRGVPVILSLPFLVSHQQEGERLIEGLTAAAPGERDADPTEEERDAGIPYRKSRGR
ncbi:MAG: hypothetical protein PHP28_12620 [Actinomycetota bacterium]|nr:hypothetical protein [Actinomycetota bacterium]MDD5668113.1 hypothetical protein [Actinomycetota bacterium]